MRAEVRAAELDHVLTGKDHRLPMHDPAAGLLQHRDPRVAEIAQDRSVSRVRRVRLGVHDDADGHTGAPSLDQRCGVARVLHEPEGHVDTHLLGTNKVE
jgi:hypothetical protein